MVASNNYVYPEQSEFYFYFEPNDSRHTYWCTVISVLHSHVEEANSSQEVILPVKKLAEKKTKTKEKVMSHKMLMT